MLIELCPTATFLMKFLSFNQIILHGGSIEYWAVLDILVGRSEGASRVCGGEGFAYSIRYLHFSSNHSLTEIWPSARVGTSFQFSREDDVNMKTGQPIFALEFPSVGKRPSQDLLLQCKCKWVVCFHCSSVQTRLSMGQNTEWIAAVNNRWNSVQCVGTKL